VFKKHRNEPLHSRKPNPERHHLPYAEIEGPLIPVISHKNIEEVSPPMLEKHADLQAALFAKERRESLSAAIQLPQPAHLVGIGKVFKKLESHTTTAYSPHFIRPQEVFDDFFIAPKGTRSPPPPPTTHHNTAYDRSDREVVDDDDENAPKIIVLGEEIKWGTPRGIYLGREDESTFTTPAPEFFDLKPMPSANSRPGLRDSPQWLQHQQVEDKKDDDVRLCAIIET
jgi:hypothetical protein